MSADGPDPHADAGTPRGVPPSPAGSPEPVGQSGPLCVIHAMRLDGHGGGAIVELDDVLRPGEGVSWVHADASSPERVSELLGILGISTRSASALSRVKTRPTFFVADDGIVLILRGVNLNPGASPDDMVSLRLLVTPTLVLSLRHRRMLAVGDLKRALEHGTGPTGPGDFVANLVECASGRMEPAIEDLVERLEVLSDRLDRRSVASAAERTELSDIRQEAARLRRYIAPQRDMLVRLLADASSGAHPIVARLFGQDERAMLHESADRFARFVEDLDLIQQRAQLTNEEISQQQASRVNRSLVILSVISVVFVPISAVTSLLGVNLPIPLENSAWSFPLLCAALATIVVLEIMLLRRLFK